MSIVESIGFVDPSVRPRGSSPGDSFAGALLLLCRTRRRTMMRDGVLFYWRGRPRLLHRVDGKVVCKRCGAQLDIPEGRTPEVTFYAESGRPVIRVVKVDREEIHRCRLVVRRLPRTARGWDD